jgi:hypothetical protein
MTLRRHAETLIRTVGVLSLVLSVPVSLAGQTCFRGRPQPRCSGFTVLEFTGGLRLNDKTSPTDEAPAFLYWSGGYLRNVGARSALGAAFKVTADSDGHRYGPVVRYRHWLSPTTSIDLAPGLFIGGEDNFVDLAFPSATADVALNYGDWFGVAVGVDAIRRTGGGTQWQSHAGVRLGTWLAPLATLGLGILVGAAY